MVGDILTKSLTKFRTNTSGKILNSDVVVYLFRFSRKRGALTATADSSHVILIVNNHPLGFGETSDIYVSEDEGVHWNRQTVPFELSGSQMKFHPNKASHILATDATSQQLWITTDFCKSWRAVHDSGKTSAFKWDPKSKKNLILIIFTSQTFR